MSRQILSPAVELRALIAAARVSLPDLSARTGIPKTRIADALAGCGELTIDDAGRCKTVLTGMLVSSARGQPPPKGQAAQDSGAV